MSRTYNEYYFEKLDIMDKLNEIGLLTRILRIVYKEQGLETIKYLLCNNTNLKFIWFNDDMMTDIINDIEEGVSYEN